MCLLKIIIQKYFLNMADPGRVVKYENMLRIIHEPEKVIIDVRNPDEYKAGKIPCSTNIPLGTVHDALSMSEAEFMKKYQREKPSQTTEIIFYCKAGKRAMSALDEALKLGYSKSKIYSGSWDDWSSH